MTKNEISHLIIGVFLLISCNAKHQNASDYYKDVIGKWECPINNDTFKGKELIYFQPDSSVKITDNITLTLSDKDIKVSIKCTARNFGKWIINKNIIDLSLDELYIDIDTATMIIAPIDAHKRLDTTNPAYTNIKKEIYNYTKTVIKNTFEERSNRRFELGNVYFHHPDSMIIINSGRTIILSRSN